VRFADAARRDGLTRTVVCGMGGSSLAPDVLASSFANPSLSVLDTTDRRRARGGTRGRARRTLFVICSKSGSTVETLAFYRYFAARADAARFVAITDPGSPLETLARERGSGPCSRIRPMWAVGMPPSRWSACFPPLWLGVNGRVLLERALAADPEAARTRGTRLAGAALAGRDKLVLRPPPPVARLATGSSSWWRKARGQGGRGVVPVVDDPMTTLRPTVRS